MRGKKLLFTVAAMLAFGSNADETTSGALYGTTQQGGAFGCGVVYKVGPAGNPDSSVIRDAAGNLYGTTYSYGADGFGVVYKLDPTGKLTGLHNFTGGADGAFPIAGVILDSAGDLYGTTFYGGDGHGPAGHGVVYKLGQGKKLTVLHTFTGGADGGYPQAGALLGR